MKTGKRRRLESTGWRFGDASDFLQLTPEEAAYIDVKLRLANQLVAKRKTTGLTQKELAARLRSSQSRIAFMEKGDPSVSVDILLKGLFALGMTRKELAKTV